MPAPGVVVRRATPADAEALAEIGRASFREAYSPSSKPEDIDDHLHRHFRATVVVAEMACEGTAYWLATLDGTPAGFAKTRSDRNPDNLPRPDLLELELLYIAPASQRRGVGEALMGRVEALAGELGFAGTWLSVWEDADWAVRFYRKRGFVAFATHTFTVGQTDFTDDLMWRALDAG